MNDINIDELKSELEKFREYSTERMDNLSEVSFHRKVFAKFSLLISVLALSVSVVAICLSLKSFSMDSFSFLGWTMSVLSFLVVVLIGWQIFNIIELRAYKKEINEWIEYRFNLSRKDFKILETNIKVLSNDINKLDNRKYEFLKEVLAEFEKNQKQKEYMDKMLHRNQIVKSS